MAEEKDTGSNFQFEDAENYRGGQSEDYSFKSIVLKQLNKCTEEGSKEMLRGGWITKIIKGIPYRVEAANQREIFCNSVGILRIILTPEIVKNKKIVEEKLMDVDNDINNAKIDYKKRYNEIIKQNKMKPDLLANKTDKLTDEFEMKKVFIHLSLLEALNFLLEHLDYFEETGFTG